ncbi:hypothetical protein [Pedobacter sp. KBS0701]|nr:hypothetical protein [Pedobacter sp. KBS0701]
MDTSITGFLAAVHISSEVGFHVAKFLPVQAGQNKIGAIDSMNWKMTS